MEELAAAIEQSGGVLRLVGAGVGAPYEATGPLFDDVITRHAQTGLGVSSEAGRLERGLSWKGRWPWLSQPGQNADQKRVLDYAFGHSELGAHEALPPALAALAPSRSARARHALRRAAHRGPFAQVPPLRLHGARRRALRC